MQCAEPKSWHYHLVYVRTTKYTQEGISPHDEKIPPLTTLYIMYMIIIVTMNLPWCVSLQLQHCESRCTIDPSYLQSSNRVHYWLGRIPWELWKIHPDFDRTVPGRHSSVCVTSFACGREPLCVSSVLIRNIISPSLIQVCFCWASQGD